MFRLFLRAFCGFFCFFALFLSVFTHYSGVFHAFLRRFFCFYKLKSTEKGYSSDFVTPLSFAAIFTASFFSYPARM